jgi:hypothetical protein
MGAVPVVGKSRNTLKSLLLLKPRRSATGAAFCAKVGAFRPWKVSAPGSVRVGVVQKGHLGDRGRHRP